MKNRWLIALSAVGIHISIGSVSAWSGANVAPAEIVKEVSQELWWFLRNRP